MRIVWVDAFTTFSIRLSHLEYVIDILEVLVTLELLEKLVHVAHLVLLEDALHGFVVFHHDLLDLV